MTKQSCPLPPVKLFITLPYFPTIDNIIPIVCFPVQKVELLSQQMQAVTRERQKLEAEAAKRKSHQSTMSKAVKNLARQAHSVVERTHELEMGKFFCLMCRTVWQERRWSVVSHERRPTKR